VVYYEDNFPAIKYPDVAGNTFEQVVNNSNLTQSPDQDQEYGRDDAYADDTDMSGDSIRKITIGAAGQVAYFDFKGTGFELISRTNAYDSAKLSIKVKELSYDTKVLHDANKKYGNVIKQGNNEIYNQFYESIKKLINSKQTEKNKSLSKFIYIYIYSFFYLCRTIVFRIYYSKFFYIYCN
jgi:hypothetical protein